MKRLAPSILFAALLAIAFAPFAVAAPNLEKIGREADAAALDLAGAKAVIGSLAAERTELFTRIDHAVQAATQNASTIDAQAKTIDDKDREIGQLKDSKLTLLSLAPGGFGTAFLIAGCAGLVFGVGRRYAVRAAIIGVPLIALSAALILYGREYALVGLIAGGVVTAGGMTFFAFEYRKLKEAGVENSNLIPLAKATGEFTDDQIATLERLAHAEGGTLADELRAEAAGISVADLTGRVREAVGLKKGRAA